MTTYHRRGQFVPESVAAAVDAVSTRVAEPALFQQPDPATQTLFEMADNLMERVRACALQHGVVLPGRQVVYLSPIPADCEQVAVVFDGWSADQTWDITLHCNAFRWMGGFSVVITRCTPAMPTRKGAAPSVQQMREAALVASHDADVLTCVVTSLSEIGPEMQIITQAPTGGFQTTELDLRLPCFGSLE